MKKWISGLIILIIIGLFSSWLFISHADKESKYQINLANGKSAIEKQEYQQAKDDFQKALKVKPDAKQANVLVNQIDKFLDGQNELKVNDFVSAKKSFKAANQPQIESTSLAKKLKQQSKLVTNILTQIDNYNSLYSQAVEQHNEKNYEASNQILNRILMDPKINQTYYSDILVKVNELKKINNNSLKPVLKTTKNNYDEHDDKKTTDKSNQNTDDKVNSTSDNNDNSVVETEKTGSTPANSYNVYSNPEEYADRFN